MTYVFRLNINEMLFWLTLGKLNFSCLDVKQIAVK